MKLPRQLSGSELAKALNVLGYAVSRTAGSHMRLTTTVNGEHHVTIPIHDALRVGTLAGILRSVAEHHQLSRDELLTQLGLG